MTKVSATILKDAASAFKLARGNVYEGARLLYQIQETNAWEGQFSSFAEFVEQECQIGKSQASKLTQMWKFYIIDGGMNKNQLVGIDSDKLYLAAKLPTGTIEQRLVKAREWNRQDLRDALAEDENGVDCVHTETIQLCKKCGKRVG